MLIPILMLIAAILILYYGAEFSLEGSEKIGQKLGLSPLVIGMLLIGFGTSLPEFFVGHIAGAQDNVGIAVGSLVGSNIANMFLILGICGLFTRMELKNKTIRDQLVVHFILGLALWFVLTRDSLNVLTAMPLIAVCGAYLFLLYKDFKNEDESKLVTPMEDFKPALIIFKLFAGFGMLYLGGELLVKSGIELCQLLGVKEYIVSAIFIAFGTSFPELVTALLASIKKKETDLIIGNIVGSNLFNCAFILGSLGIYDFRFEDSFYIEIGALIFGATLLLLLSFFKRAFYRLSGFVFFLTYILVVYSWTKEGGLS